MLRRPVIAAMLFALPAGIQAQDAATALAALCGPEPLLGVAAEAPLGGAWLLDEDLRTGRGGSRLNQRFATSTGELRIDRIDGGGGLRRFQLETWADGPDGLRPTLQVRTDAQCGVGFARRLDYADGRVAAMAHLGADLETVLRIEPLDAPVPRGRDPGGPRVALIDSGLTYDLPLFVDRLARGADGAALGWDFWDDDPRPYDADFARGPFALVRHGTAVASILIREAPPDAALIPFRYPLRDMARLGDAVRRAAAAGARVIAMPLGSANPDDWTRFAA
ncbi:MAG: hypothetical protein AAF684_09680, partial [Pseudomonadota bacterium]